MASEDFYFFSTEGYAKGLPVKAHFVRKLSTASGREAVLIRCDKRISGYDSEYLVLVPRHQNASFADIKHEEQVFAHMLSGREHADKSEIDLSGGSRLIVDIGGISRSLDVAKKWQLSKAEAERIRPGHR